VRKQHKNNEKSRALVSVLPWKLTDFFVLDGVTSLRSLPPLSGSKDVLPRSESRDPTELFELTEPAFPVKRTNDGVISHHNQMWSYSKYFLNIHERDTAKYR